MRAASLALAMVALFQLTSTADAELDALRVRAADATAASAAAHEELAASLASREREERALRRLEAEGEGFFASGRIRRQSAAVRGAVEVSLSRAEKARIANEQRMRASAALRDGLFLAASAATRAGDDEARAGRTTEAQEAYRRAASRLAEASRIGAAADADPEAGADPFAGLDLAIPLIGTESERELAAISAAYRRAADECAARTASIAPRLAAAQAAADAWVRLSRFRGVLERAGGATADPRPARDRLAAQAERGRLVETVLRRRADDVDVRRIGSREVSP